MEKKTSFVDEYLKMLGISPASDVNELYSECKKIGDSARVQQLERIVSQRADNYESKSDSALYNKKNADENIAILFTGGMDYNYLASLFSWVLENKDHFGTEILEVGCDIGFVSCFLGLAFPDKHITSIDKYDKSIQIAKRQADKLQISNVTFVRSDVSKITDKYDTVFSSRTVHENAGACFADLSFSLVDIGNHYEQSLKKYSEILTRLIKDGGNLISCERMELDPRFLGWMWALSERGYYLQPESHKSAKIKEAGSESCFQFGVYGRKSGIQSREDLLDFFNEAVCKESDISDIKGNWGTAKGWAALSALYICADSFVEGYRTTDKTGKSTFARYAVYTNRYDRDSSLVYQYLCNTVRITNNTFASLKNQNILSIRQSARNDIANGFTVYKLKSENGVEKTGERVKEI